MVGELRAFRETLLNRLDRCCCGQRWSNHGLSPKNMDGMLTCWGVSPTCKLRLGSRIKSLGLNWVYYSSFCFFKTDFGAKCGHSRLSCHGFFGRTAMVAIFQANSWRRRWDGRHGEYQMGIADGNSRWILHDTWYLYYLSMIS